MPHSSRWSVAGVTLLTLGLAAGAIVPLLPSEPGAAIAADASPNTFPDIQNHWARPFIESLAQHNILRGYLDGTFRPDQPIDRDEFAAILRQAFHQKSERHISSGSAFKDVPKGYWAAPAIKSAYDAGFMQGYPGGNFRPKQPLTRTEALVSLVDNLEVPRTPVTSSSQTTSTPPQPAAALSASQSKSIVQAQSAALQHTRKRLMYPMAMTMLMQPLIAAPAQAATAIAATAPSPMPHPSAAPAPAAQSQRFSTRSPVANVLSYYKDADRIPRYAVAPIATATQARIVVDYPDPRLLRPRQPTTRAEAAAFIYQALVSQGELSPLAPTTAANYIVNPKQGSSLGEQARR